MLLAWAIIVLLILLIFSAVSWGIILSKFARCSLPHAKGRKAVS